MAQYTPTVFGPIHFAHPSVMPNFIPSSASLGSRLRKHARSVIALINRIKIPLMASPTSTQSSHGLLAENPPRSHSVAPSSRISELAPSYRRSCLSFSSDASFSSASQHGEPEETDVNDDILYIKRVEMTEQQQADRKIVDLLGKDRVLDQELRRLGF
ncbi:BQ2448_1209 [Microbotryum intermedium]|uniref:BQ2448_1209 protein n=1 Tax=Microbotryum intermedium TaxID=269621 RepID=A0A238F9D3_9BASI|nr:BQ2448_1209 [Microbotryum intermedium]